MSERECVSVQVDERLIIVRNIIDAMSVHPTHTLTEGGGGRDDGDLMMVDEEDAIFASHVNMEIFKLRTGPPSSQDNTITRPSMSQFTSGNVNGRANSRSETNSPLQACVVVDTNYWISHLEFCAALLKILPASTPVMVPKIVLQELDALKNTSPIANSSRKPRDIGYLSRQAISLINNAFQSKSHAIIGQRAHESVWTASMTAVASEITNDDRILDYAMYCLQFVTPNVHLLSDDKNLCTKAMIERISSHSNYKGSPESFAQLVSQASIDSGAVTVTTTNKNTKRTPILRKEMMIKFAESEMSNITSARKRKLPANDDIAEVPKTGLKKQKNAEGILNFSYSLHRSIMTFSLSRKNNDSADEVMEEVLDMFVPSLRPSLSKILINSSIEYHHAVLACSSGPDSPLYVVAIFEQHYDILATRCGNFGCTRGEFLQVKLPAIRRILTAAQRMRDRGKHSAKAVPRGDMHVFVQYARPLWKVCRAAGFEKDFVRANGIFDGWTARLAVS
ncbi:hypothetical protein HDU84_001613 [Entophlyctis sp. JEL0112]|nr:hypothetical protein HDU84_001613 [Entophlyctis sp. JEL0112]